MNFIVKKSKGIMDDSIYFFYPTNFVLYCVASFILYIYIIFECIFLGFMYFIVQKKLRIIS